MVLYALALFVVSLGYGVVVPLLPRLAGGSDPHLIGVIYAVYAAAKIGMQLPGGAWVDRAGARKVLLIGLALYTVSLSGFLIDGGMWWFAFVRGVEGAATGLVFPAVFALALQGSQEGKSGTRIGIISGIGTSGLLVGPALAALLSARGARLPILIAISLSALVVLAELLFASRRALVMTPRTVRAEVRKIVVLASDAAFLGLLLPVAFNKLTFSSFQGLLPLYGPEAFGLDTKGVAFLFILTGVCFALAQVAGGVLADKLPARAVVLATTAPLLSALVFMALARGPAGFTLAYATYVCASSVIYTATLRHVAASYGTNDTYGGVYGVLGTLTDLMTIAGPLLFLNLYGALSGSVFLAMAATGLPFALGFLWLTRRSRQRAADRW